MARKGSPPMIPLALGYLGKSVPSAMLTVANRVICPFYRKASGLRGPLRARGPGDRRRDPVGAAQVSLCCRTVWPVAAARAQPPQQHSVRVQVSARRLTVVGPLPRVRRHLDRTSRRPLLHSLALHHLQRDGPRFAPGTTVATHHAGPLAPRHQIHEGAPATWSIRTAGCHEGRRRFPPS